MVKSSNFSGMIENLVFKEFQKVGKTPLQDKQDGDVSFFFFFFFVHNLQA